MDDRLLAEGDTRVKGWIIPDTRVRGSVDSYADYAPPRDSTKVVAAGDDSEAGAQKLRLPAKQTVHQMRLSEGLLCRNHPCEE